MASTSQSKEIAVAGRTTGLMEESELVTWEATHFGIKQKLTVKMTSLNKPTMFEDEMISGAFSSMKHRHSFRESKSGTEMTDRFEFRAPLGILGKIAEIIFLKKYMESFIMKRNAELKHMAESNQWKDFIDTPAEQDGSGNVASRRT